MQKSKPRKPGKPIKAGFSDKIQSFPTKKLCLRVIDNVEFKNAKIEIDKKPKTDKSQF